MACVLVHTDVVDGHPTPAALAILGEGRRIASALGASLYAVAFTADDDPAVEGALNAALGHGGADRSVVISGATPPALWLTRGPALARACELLRPSLVLLAADAAGRDIGPRLAARLGAAFVAEPTVEAGPRGEIVFARPVYDGELWRRLQLDELEQPAVVTLSADRPAARGTDDAELVHLAVVPPPVAAGVELSVEPAAPDPLVAARVIVVAGAGVAPSAMPLVVALADRLGGEVAGTRAVCERGQVAADRMIGVGARTVHPALYVVCGASGSMAHLGAVSPDAEIVAIDRDPRAPIWRAARWGLVGALEEQLPALLAALEAAP